MPYRCLMCLMLAGLLPTLSWAEVYRWVDEHGRVHFSDKARSDAIQLEVLGDTSGSSQDVSEDELSREEKRKRLLDAMQEDRLERDKKREEELARKKEMRLRCAELRDHLRNVQRAAGVYKLDENGERKFYSNKQRSDTEDRLKTTIAKYCR